MRKLLRWLALVMLIALMGCEDWHRYELGSLFNDSESKGSFFLGCGTIKDTEYLFAWVRENEHVGWFRIQAPATWCRIIMDEDEQPYLMTETWKGKYIFHVPEGTIIRKYELR
ncbi:hypothetical protein [Acidithiobacillus sp.]|uniref:hypothetical protein n=1 Tax=Acidithiobacillus sp. TaxID=1872118 RepID=UPI0025901EE1|nr:hypothetical protein [Acidithiobacillus sp.]MDD5375760.1 hypothetical protein [Acidithiobacillus sp.]MDD5547110.1 hypothetical protein [Candidatus Omnitrophota bacterium]